MEIRCAGETEIDRERESLSLLLISVLPSHTSHIHQCVSPPLAVVWLQSLCVLTPLTPPHHPHPPSPAFAASVIFTFSPFFDPLADIDEFPSAAQDLVKTSQESFQSEKKV